MSSPQLPPRRPRRSAAHQPPRSLSRAVMLGAVALIALLIVVAVARVALRPSLPTVDRAEPGNAKLVAAGQRLYATRCSGCHADVAVLLADGAAARPDEQLFTIIQAGGAAVDPALSTMPAFNSLSETEIWAIVSYMRSEASE